MISPRQRLEYDLPAGLPSKTALQIPAAEPIADAFGTATNADGSSYLICSAITSSIPMTFDHSGSLSADP